MTIGELYLNVELYDSVELASRARLIVAMPGTKCLLMRNGSTIIGQMDATLSIDGTPINVSSKSDRDFQRLINGELNGGQITIAGQVLYNTDAAYVAMRSDARNGNRANYSFVYPSGERFSASFIPNNPTDRAIAGEKVTSDLSLLSSGIITRVLPQ